MGTYNLAKKLTVIIPAHNEGNSIYETVRSVQAQTTPPHKIVVVDNASTDIKKILSDISPEC